MSTTEGGGNIVTDNLVLYLDAANTRSYPGTGTIWSDLSIGGNTGTLTNGPTFDSSNGGSIVFDGVNDWVNVTNSLLFANATNLSVSIWFNFSTISANTFSLIHKGRQEAPRNYWWLAYTYISPANRRFNWETGDGAGNLNQIAYSFLPSVNTWYNIVGTFQPNLSKIYLNGLEVASASTTVASIAANDGIGTYIGTYRNLGYFFPGKLNGALIYRKTLSASEVLQNFNATRSRFGI